MVFLSQLPIRSQCVTETTHHVDIASAIVWHMFETRSSTKQEKYTCHVLRWAYHLIHETTAVQPWAY